jgi:hypothetical protein
VRRDQRSPGVIPPLDLARGAGVPGLLKSRKQASENGKDCRMRKRTTRARQEPAIQREKVANSAARAHVHSSHAAHKAAGAAACIPATCPHRATPCGLRCALPSCSPGE